MIDCLYGLDVKLFFLINQGMRSSFLDWFMPMYTDFDIYKKIFIVSFAVFALWWGRKKVFWEMVTAGAAVGFTDLICAQILKNSIARVRPCHVLENVHMLKGCSSSFSMPSNHAANIFCAFTVICFFYPKATYVLLPAGLVVAISRVYVGVHYPSDALAGMAIGILFGSIALFVKSFIGKKWDSFKVKGEKETNEE